MDSIIAAATLTSATPSAVFLKMDKTTSSFATVTASSHRAKLQQQRLRFALFLKILFKRLQDTDEKLLYVQAKMVVMSCSQRSRMGDEQFSPLIDAIEIRLRELVGEVHWRRAHGYMRYYIKSRRPRVLGHKLLDISKSHSAAITTASRYSHRHTTRKS